MRGIEKALTSYVKGNGRKVSKEVLSSCIEEDSNELINTLLKVINSELDKPSEALAIDRLKELFHYIQITLGVSSEVDRTALMRRLSKLDAKIDRLKVERKNQFKDKKKATAKLEKIRDEIESVTVQTEEKETKQYDFIDYLVNEVKNITYLEYTFMKLPNLVNIRDKNDKSLFQNVVKKYLESFQQEEEKENLYYGNVLSLLLSEKHFHITEVEKRKVLDLLFKTLNQMNKNKGFARQYREKVNRINALVTTLKDSTEKRLDIDQIAQKYSISVRFPKSILEQIDLLKIPVPGNTNRYIVDDYAVTIDKEGAIEIDDALSCKRLPNGNYLLGVHIASPLGYFPYESKFMNEALSRNKSIYLPSKYQTTEDDFQKIIPMFPYEFATAKASLIEHEPRLARSYFFELSSDGSIVEEKFLKTIISSHKKMSFEEVDEILLHGSENKRLYNTIENLQKVSDILDKRYKTSTTYEEVKESMNDYSDLRVRRLGAEKIVYQAMLLTGNRVASFFAKNGYPCLYRVHQMNEKGNQRLQEMLASLTKTFGGEQYQKLSQLISGIYPKGWYDLRGRHEGLGVDHHCHCTSSLRRAADIIVEHAEEVCYDKYPTDKELIQLEKEIKTRLDQINAKEDPTEWFVKDYKRAYAKRR